MKHAIRGCWRNSRALLVACLLGACCTAVWATVRADTGQVIHITSAEMMVTDASSFRPISSKVDAGTLAGPWIPVDLPHKFAEPLVPAANGTTEPAPLVTTWYRISLDKLKPSHNMTHFYLVHWQSAGHLAVYGDGQLLYRSLGTAAWNYFRNPTLLIPLNLTTEAAPPKDILIRMDNRPSSGGGAISSIYAGDTDALYSLHMVRDWYENQLPFIGNAGFLAVGFFSLAVWLSRRREPLYFLLFAIAVLAAIRRWYYFAGLEKLLISDNWFGWLTFNALVWQIVALQFFLVQLHKINHPWLNRGLVGFAIILTLLTLPWSSTQSGVVPFNLLLYLAPVAAAAIMFSVNLWDSWRSNSRDAKLLASWIVVSLLLSIHDLLHRRFQFNIEGFNLTPYAAMGLCAVLMYIMFRRYVSAIGEVEQLNAGLEQRLQARETELMESHRKLREIEHRETLAQERQRLMQDMHDGLGSSLVSALRVVEHGRIDETEVAQVLKGCIDDLKLAIDSMEPVDANLLLLLATLRYRLGPRLESTGIALRWEVEDVPALDWLNPKNALHILRILQEAFSNIIKHTLATEIRVATKAEGDYVVVTVADNGQGFSVDGALKSGGKGLSNQIRRAEAIGAEVGWDSSAAGTCFTLRLPIKRKQA